MRRRGDARLADDRMVDPHDVISQRLGYARRAVHRVAPAADDHRGRVHEAPVARLRRFRQVAASAPGKTRHDRAGVRRLSSEPAQDIERVAKRRRIRHRRSRRDRAEIVADHIRDRERSTRAGRMCREPAPFNRRHVLPHGVEGVDIGAGAEQDFGGRPFVIERDAGGGNSHQRRRAARKQNEKGFVGAKRAGDRERTASGLLAAGRRHRMATGNRLER